jgi:hypothetical protein
MAEKKPIVNYSGQLKELQPGDTLPSQSNVIAKSKSGDESVTSSTTSQNDDHLVLNIGANETWLIQYDIFLTVGASTNFKWKLSVPSGGSAAAHVKPANSANGADISDATSDTTSTTSTASGSNHVHYQIFAKVTSSSTAGAVQLQWAQGTSNGTALTLKSRSKLVAVRE